MRLAVVIATYYRADHKSAFYLKRALDSVFNQTHKDFIVFLIGDDYTNENELSGIVADYPGEKLFWCNFDIAPERSKYKGGMKLWCCCGVTAINFGIEKALEFGFDYICHLDHDDYWKADHLEVINNAIELKKADWICTKSKYGKQRTLPEIKSLEYFINFLPLPGGIVRSSVCFNHRKIPLKFINTLEEKGISIPSDADLWERTAKYIKENKLISILVNEKTCYHEEEGYLLHAN